jgi:hypothetical protein
MEPSMQNEPLGSEPVDDDVAMEGDDLLDQASGGKGVNRNSFSLD